MEDADVKLFLTEALSSHGSATRAEALAPQMQEAHQAQEELAANFTAFVGKLTTRMHVTDWAQEQHEDPTLLAIIKWIQDRKRGKTLRERLEKTTDKDTIAQIMRIHHNLVIKTESCTDSTCLKTTAKRYINS